MSIEPDNPPSAEPSSVSGQTAQETPTPHRFEDWFLTASHISGPGEPKWLVDFVEGMSSEEIRLLAGALFEEFPIAAFAGDEQALNWDFRYELEAAVRQDPTRYIRLRAELRELESIVQSLIEKNEFQATLRCVHLKSRALAEEIRGLRGPAASGSRSLSRNVPKATGARKRKRKQATRRRKRNAPKAAERRAQREEQRKIDKEILSDWLRETREDYEDYVDWKNENLPPGWPTLSRRYVELAIGREKARLKRAGKWPLRKSYQ